MSAIAKFQPAEEPKNDFMAERAVIVGCLIQPDRIGECGLLADDFEGPFHRRIWAVLAGLRDEGRHPSVEAVSAFFGEEEIAPNLTPRKYIRNIVAENLVHLQLPFGDAVETVRDASQRRSMRAAAEELALAATYGSRSIRDMASDAIARIDDVLASLKEGRRRAYDASGAADLAMQNLDSDEPPAPTTGLIDLDRVIGGWPVGQLSIVAGRPGAGKSAVATSCVLKAARAGFPVCFFSLEMIGEQLGARLLTDIAYSYDRPIFYEDIINRRVADDWQRERLDRAHERLRGVPLHIEEQRGLTIAEITARSRKLAARMDREGTPLKLIVVDHIGLVRASARYAGNRVRELAEITDGLASIAKELNVAVIGLCQLNRDVEKRDNKRPTESDLRESGAIEEDASVIVLLYRPAYYLEKERFDQPEAEMARREQLEATRHCIELNVSKNRNGHPKNVDAFIDIGANALRDADFGNGRKPRGY